MKCKCACSECSSRAALLANNAAAAHVVRMEEVYHGHVPLHTGNAAAGLQPPYMPHLLHVRHGAAVIQERLVDVALAHGQGVPQPVLLGGGLKTSKRSAKGRRGFVRRVHMLASAVTVQTAAHALWAATVQRAARLLPEGGQAQVHACDHVLGVHRVARQSSHATHVAKRRSSAAHGFPRGAHPFEQVLQAVGLGLHHLQARGGLRGLHSGCRVHPARVPEVSRSQHSVQTGMRAVEEGGGARGAVKRMMPAASCMHAQHRSGRWL